MELAWTLTDFGELEVAEKLLTEADSLNEPLADFRLGALLALVRGRFAEAMAHPKDAEKLYRHSAAVFAEIDDRVNLSQAQNHLACLTEN